MLKKLVIGLLTTSIMVGGIGLGVWYVKNPLEAEQKPPAAPLALLVEAQQVLRGNYTVKVTGMGQVIPAVEIDFKTQVNGEITDVAGTFVPGGYLFEEEDAVRIDQQEYLLAVHKQEAILKQAAAAYALELGRQDVARAELAMLMKTTGIKPENTDLALRLPQLAEAMAVQDKAQVDLDLARLRLKRTIVRAPFNALVTKRYVAVGDKVMAQDILATLVNTDTYWVEVALSVHDVKWLRFAGRDTRASSAIVLLDGERGSRKATVLNLTGTLDTNSRLARVLVAVSDPLLLEDEAESGAVLLLGDYVRVEIEGSRLENVIRLPVSWVRDGHVIWVMKEGKLHVQSVTPVYEDRKYVYVSSGLEAYDMVVTSDISIPAAGMLLRQNEDEAGK